MTYIRGFTVTTLGLDEEHCFFNHCLELTDSIATTNPANFTPINWTAVDLDECEDLGGTLVGSGCHTKHYVADVFFFSCIVFLGTFAMAYTLKHFRTARFFPSIVRMLQLLRVTSHEHHGVSNHQQPKCLFNSFYQASNKGNIGITSPLWKGTQGMDSPLKGPVVLEISPCHDPSISILDYHQVSNIRRTKSQHTQDSRTVLRLSLPNPLKWDVKSKILM